jgi:hypothetical protein
MSVFRRDRDGGVAAVTTTPRLVAVPLPRTQPEAELMTDRCDSARLGRQRLHHEADNTLWYQQDGVVAAGSQPLSRQVTNAREHGFRDDEIWQLIAGTAHRVFALSGAGTPGRP